GRRFSAAALLIGNGDNPPHRRGPCYQLSEKVSTKRRCSTWNIVAWRKPRDAPLIDHQGIRCSSSATGHQRRGTRCSRSGSLYLEPMVAMIQLIANLGMIDRRVRGPWRP